MYLLLATILIGLELSYEGLKLRGWHKVSGIIEFTFLAFVILIVYFWATGCYPSLWQLDYSDNFWKIIIGYVFFRFGWFSPVLNIVRGKPIAYIGSTKIDDIVLYWIITKLHFAQEHLLFIRFVFFVWGFAWLLCGNTDRI